MNKALLARGVLPLLALLTLGCDDDARWSPETSVPTTPPLALTDALLYTPADAPNDADVLTLDLAGAKPRVLRHAPASAVAARAQPAGGTTAVLLTAGRAAYDEGGKRHPSEPSQVLAFDRLEQRAERTLSGRYASLALSGDARFAVAHAPSGSLVLQNAIEVVDLATPERTPVVVNLELDGRVPTSFVFSPKESFGRRIVVIPFPGAVMLLDLEHPEHGAISVPLTTPGDARTLPPQRVLFAGDQIFVQSSGGSEVLVLELLTAADTRHGFRVVPSLLTAGSALRDVALIGSGEQLRLVALANEVALLDPRRGSTTSVAAGGSAFTSVIAFEGRSPFDTLSAPRGLLFAPGSSRVGFVELGGGDGWAGRTIEPVELGEPLTAVLPLVHHKLALGLHAGARLSVIKLEDRTVDPYRLDAPLSSWLLDEDAARARVWVASAAGKLGRIDLLARVTLEVPIRLPVGPGSVHSEPSTARRDDVGRLLLVPGTPRRVALLHGSEVGRVTLLDAETPTRETALELAGFFLAGLFD